MSPKVWLVAHSPGDVQKGGIANGVRSRYARSLTAKGQRHAFIDPTTRPFAQAKSPRHHSQLSSPKHSRWGCDVSHGLYGSRTRSIRSSYAVPDRNGEVGGFEICAAAPRRCRRRHCPARSASGSRYSSPRRGPRSIRMTAVSVLTPGPTERSILIRGARYCAP
jgi:hypothetical protein